MREYNLVKNIAEGAEPINPSTGLPHRVKSLVQQLGESQKPKINRSSDPGAIAEDWNYKGVDTESYLDYGVNFEIGYDNDEARAQKQSSIEQVAKQIPKFAGKTALNVVGGLAGTIYGAGAAIVEGDFSALYDNAVMNKLEHMKESIDKALPVYNTNAYKDANFLQKMFLHPAQLSDELSDALAFTAGAVLTGMITGGAYNALLPVRALKAMHALDKAAKAGKGLNAMNSMASKMMGANAGRMASQLFFGANYEAMVETKHSMMELESKLRADLKKQNYSQEEIDKIVEEQVTSAEKFSWAANIGVVGGSNLLQFPSIFGVKYGQNLLKATRNNILLDADNVAKAAYKGYSKTGKIANNIWTAAKNPMTEGLWEEGMQGVISRTSTDYWSRAYDPEHKDSVNNFVNSFGRNILESYGTKEGWNEIGLGMLVGGMGSAGRGNLSVLGKNNALGKYGFHEDGSRREFWTGGIKGAFDERSQKRANIDKLVDEINKDPNVLPLIKAQYEGLIRHASIQKDQDRALEVDDKFGYLNHSHDKIHNWFRTRIKAGLYDEAVDQVEELRDMSPEEFSQELFGEKAEVSVNKFQQNQIIDSIVNKAKEAKSATELVDKVYTAQTKNPEDDNVREDLIHAVTTMKDVDGRITDMYRSVSDLTRGNITELHIRQVNNQLNKLKIEQIESLIKQGKLTEEQQTNAKEVLKRLRAEVKKDSKIVEGFELEEEEILNKWQEADPTGFATHLTEVYDMLSDVNKLTDRRGHFIDLYNRLLTREGQEEAKTKQEEVKPTETRQEDTKDPLTSLKEVNNNTVTSQELAQEIANDEVGMPEGVAQDPTEGQEVDWNNLINSAVNNRELDKIVDQIDTQEAMTPELFDSIATKRSELEAQPEQQSEETTQEEQEQESESTELTEQQIQEQRELFEEFTEEVAPQTKPETKKEGSLEDKKADIERISKLPYQERVSALIEAGIIASDLTFNLGNRFPIILNIAGTKVAFYRSSEGTGGKKKGAWTPMFGFGEHKGNPWLIKGDIDTQVNKNYNSKAIEEYTNILNKTLNWDHELDKGQVKNHPFLKVLKLAESQEAFNKELYGVEDLGIINGQSNVSGFINSKLSEINDKYDAELAALEQVQETEDDLPVGNGKTFSQASFDKGFKLLNKIVNDYKLDPATYTLPDIISKLQVFASPEEITSVFKALQSVMLSHQNMSGNSNVGDTLNYSWDGTKLVHSSQAEVSEPVEKIETIESTGELAPKDPNNNSKKLLDSLSIAFVAVETITTVNSDNTEDHRQVFEPSGKIKWNKNHNPLMDSSFIQEGTELKFVIEEGSIEDADNAQIGVYTETEPGVSVRLGALHKPDYVRENRMAVERFDSPAEAEAWLESEKAKLTEVRNLILSNENTTFVAKVSHRRIGMFNELGKNSSGVKQYNKVKDLAAKDPNIALGVQMEGEVRTNSNFPIQEIFEIPKGRNLILVPHPNGTVVPKIVDGTKLVNEQQVVKKLSKAVNDFLDNKITNKQLQVIVTRYSQAILGDKDIAKKGITIKQDKDNNRFVIINSVKIDSSNKDKIETNLNETYFRINKDLLVGDKAQDYAKEILSSNLLETDLDFNTVTNPKTGKQEQTYFHQITTEFEMPEQAGKKPEVIEEKVPTVKSSKDVNKRLESLEKLTDSLEFEDDISTPIATKNLSKEDLTKLHSELKLSLPLQEFLNTDSQTRDNIIKCR
jgi:hypothetical protein